MPETFYTSSQYYNLFFHVYFNRGLPMPLNKIGGGSGLCMWSVVCVGVSVCVREVCDVSGGSEKT